MSQANSISIRAAAIDDVPLLALIAAECELHIDFAGELARSYALLWVAWVASQPVGLLLVWRAADELHLTDLGVTASARRAGVARALLAELRRAGARGNSRVILLEVRAGNAAALALYRAEGFAELDRRARYYADTGEDAVVMQLELR